MDRSWYLGVCLAFGSLLLLPHVSSQESISFSLSISSAWEPLLPCVYRGIPYLHGESWKADECTTCTCDNTTTTCVIESCQPALCPEPIKPEGECCFRCLYNVIVSEINPFIQGRLNGSANGNGSLVLGVDVQFTNTQATTGVTGKSIWDLDAWLVPTNGTERISFTEQVLSADQRSQSYTKGKPFNFLDVMYSYSAPSLNCEEVNVCVELKRGRNAQPTNGTDFNLQGANGKESLTGCTSLCSESTTRCLNITVDTAFRQVRLPMADVGDRINSTETCPAEYSEDPDTPIIRAICQIRNNGSTYWNTSIQCNGSLTRQLENIVKVGISEENKKAVAQELFTITQNYDDIGLQDITLLYEILQSIDDLNTTDANVTYQIAGIVNNMMYIEEEVLTSVQESGNFTTRIVQILESQLNKVYIGNSKLETSYPNIAIQVLDLPPDGAADGLVLTIFSMDTGDLRNSYFSVGTHQDTAFDSVPRETFARVAVPIEVTSVLTTRDVKEGPSSFTNTSYGDNLAPGVTSGSKDTMGTGNNETVRIAFAVYVNDALFPSASLTRYNMDQESLGVTRQINTPIVSLAVDGQKIGNLMQRVNITFLGFKSDSRDPTCNFWEFDLGKWSTTGCQLLPDVLRVVDSSGDLYYTCACDHLTNFAVLVDMYAGDEPPKPVLRLLSIIGCVISCLCLVITIMSYLSVKKVRGSQTHRIFICLCFTLLCLYIASLAIIALDREYQYAELEWIPCTVLAALVHYFVLSSLTWMGIEGFNTYLVIIRVFDTHIRHYMIKAAFVGWGIPAVIVGITGGITRNTYAIEDYCYIQQWPLIGGLLIPMAFILIVNITVFILAMCRLERSARLPGRVKKDYKAHRQETLERVQNGIAILVLLGFSWTTGYLTLVNVDLADLLFIISNSLQGFFIFVLYCLRKATIREQWRRCLCCALFREDGSAGSRGTSGQTPGPRPTIGTGGSRPPSEPSSPESHTNQASEGNNSG